MATQGRSSFCGNVCASSRMTTLRAMLCEQSDDDWFAFPVQAGDRIRINPRSLTPGMTLFRQFPGGGFYEDNAASEQVMSLSGNYILGVHSQEAIDNLPYVIDVEVIPAPTPTPLPNNWTCTTYPASDVPHRIEDLVTFSSAITVPVSGTGTHVGLKNLTFEHNALYDVSFGLRAPDGTQADLFHFQDYGFYTWCCGSNCHVWRDDAAG